MWPTTFGTRTKQKMEKYRLLLALRRADLTSGLAPEHLNTLRNWLGKSPVWLELTALPQIFVQAVI